MFTMNRGDNHLFGSSLSWNIVIMIITTMLRQCLAVREVVRTAVRDGSVAELVAVAESVQHLNMTPVLTMSSWTT